VSSLSFSINFQLSILYSILPYDTYCCSSSFLFLPPLFGVNKACAIFSSIPTFRFYIGYEKRKGKECRAEQRETKECGSDNIISIVKKTNGIHNTAFVNNKEKSAAADGKDDDGVCMCMLCVCD
jgi:hypothetical protein